MSGLDNPSEMLSSWENKSYKPHADLGYLGISTINLGINLNSSIASKNGSKTTYDQMISEGTAAVGSKNR